MDKFINPNLKVNYPFRVFVRDVIHYVRPYRWRFIAASFCRLAGDIAWLYPAYGLASIVSFLSHFTPGQSLQRLWAIFSFWLLAIAVRICSQFSCRVLGFYVAEKTTLDSLNSGIRHLFLLDMAWHEQENSGNKLKRIQNGSSALNKIFRVWIANLIEVTVNLVGATFIISRFNGALAAGTAVFFVTYFTISFFLTRRAAAAEYLVGVEEEKVNGLLSEAVGNIRSVKAMGMAQSLSGFIAQATAELMGRIKVRIFRFMLRYSTLSAWSWLFQMSMLAFIVVGITQGRYEVGFLILFNSYFGRIWEATSELSDVSQDITVAKYSISRMNETLAVPVGIDSEEGKVAFPEKWKTISVQNLSFAYAENEVLSNVSFDIHRGEKIGIVGLSGAGKSTLFKLLLKEYEATEGDIKVDGVSLRTISKADYFRYASVVLQETDVFNFSFKDNITIVNPDRAADTKLLSRVLKIAHVAELVRKLPDGIDTLIGERGVKLSGGEKQRLGIARAIFKQPQLLLLDEATSHLDLESEEKIRESLHEFFEHVTAVVIAHRLTTIREMDKIILFEGGRILESGNFDELYAEKGRFYELWEKQRL
jgi:ABC-type multidrug transport system fused ATPase/permease subunit